MYIPGDIHVRSNEQTSEQIHRRDRREYLYAYPWYLNQPWHNRVCDVKVALTMTYPPRQETHIECGNILFAQWDLSKPRFHTGHPIIILAAVVSITPTDGMCGYQKLPSKHITIFVGRTVRRLLQNLSGLGRTCHKLSKERIENN